MRAIVTCECCGHRQAVARPIGRPEAFHVVCHECEGILRVEVTADDLSTAQKSIGARARRASRPSPGQGSRTGLVSSRPGPAGRVRGRIAQLVRALR